MALKLVLAVISLLAYIEVVLATVYDIKVKTGYVTNAGTNANVFVTIYGTNGTKPKTQLKASGIDPFERGNTNDFAITTTSNLGNLTKLTVEHDDNGFASGWFLNNIIVWDRASSWPKSYFECYKWLDTTEGDGKTSRTLPALTVYSPSKDYVVKVITGKKLFAGTNSHVYIILSGSKGRTPKIELKNSKKNPFEKGDTDTFDVKAVDLGQLSWLYVDHDDTGRLPGWYLDKIIVYDKANENLKYSFVCERWLAKDEDDKKVARNLTAQFSLAKAPTDECPGAKFDFIDNHCVITENCTKIICQKSLYGRVVKVEIKIHKCDKPVTVDVKVQLFSFIWEHTFEGDDLVKIPNLPIPFVTTKLKVHIEDNGQRLQFKVSIKPKILLLPALTITLINVDLPITTKECPNRGSSFWDTLSSLYKGFVIGGTLATVIIVCLCCFCCYKMFK